MADFDRLDRAVRATREHVQLGWDDARVDALLRRAKARARRRTVYRVAVAAAALIALAFGATLAWPEHTPERVAARALVEPTVENRVLHLADGSVVTLLDQDADVVIMRVSEEEIRLRLTRGAARFDVVPGLPRAFRVNAGEVDIEVVGTVFEVRRDGSGARVRVLEGRVRVAWPVEHELVLTEGGSGRFPTPELHGDLDLEAHGDAEHPERPAREPDTAPREEEPALEEQPREVPRRVVRPERRARRVRHVRERAPRRWVELAEAGEYEAASELLEDAPLEEASLDELLLASDTMRLTGRPERALDYLDRAAVLAETDHRAPLVAFTRGRLLLTALSRPYDAAEAFQRARALAPNGSLAMDALAREVEARARAGDAESARARAEEYVARYPNGLRIAAVRRWGALDP